MGTLDSERAPRYGAYLLRYWEERSDCPVPSGSWHFSLEKAGTGVRRAFHDLAALLAYLERELERDSAGASSGNENGRGLKVHGGGEK